jgi:hypothetical protein
MTLQVSFDQFAETVKRLLKLEEAYVAPHDCGALITAAKPGQEIVIASVSTMKPKEASASLKTLGLTVFEGTWLTPEELMAPDLEQKETFIAAVSYRSSGEKAGVWVDAYPSMPNQVTVLRAMYDDFTETGEVHDVPFEEFVQLANPNVVIVTPSDIEGFVRQKEGC